MLGDSRSWLHEPVIIPPAVLTGSTASHIWTAINQKGPLRVWDFFSDVQLLGLLFLISDRCNTNICIINNAIANKPSHVAIANHPCNLHETHHGSRMVFLQQKYLNVMFCASNVLRSGPTYRDLLASIRAALRKQFRVSVDPPDPANRAFASAVLDATYLTRFQSDGDSMSDLQISQRREKANDLLKMFNGDWRSPWVTHHCHLQCCKTNEVGSWDVTGSG